MPGIIEALDQKRIIVMILALLVSTGTLIVVLVSNAKPEIQIVRPVENELIDYPDSVLGTFKPSWIGSNNIFVFTRQKNCDSCDYFSNPANKTRSAQWESIDVRAGNPDSVYDQEIYAILTEHDYSRDLYDVDRDGDRTDRYHVPHKDWLDQSKAWDYVAVKRQ